MNMQESLIKKYKELDDRVTSMSHDEIQDLCDNLLGAGWSLLGFYKYQEAEYMFKLVEEYCHEYETSDEATKNKETWLILSLYVGEFPDSARSPIDYEEYLNQSDHLCNECDILRVSRANPNTGS